MIEIDKGGIFLHRRLTNHTSAINRLINKCYKQLFL